MFSPFSLHHPNIGTAMHGAVIRRPQQDLNNRNLDGLFTLLRISAVSNLKFYKVVFGRVAFDPLRKFVTNFLHFGMITAINLEFGIFTRPLGLNLIVAMTAFCENFQGNCRAVLSFVGSIIWVLLVVTFVPLNRAVICAMETFYWREVGTRKRS